MPAAADLDLAAIELLVRLLDGQHRASAFMPWGKPGPILLPDDQSGRERLVQAHIAGGPATVLYSPANGTQKLVAITQVVLAAYCPGTDGNCRWIAFDIDSAKNHGCSGLLDPDRAVRCLAERADAAGLLPGLIVVASKSGHGRHVWLLLPRPTPLAEAALGAAMLAAMALRIAQADHEEGDVPHAFASAAGPIVAPGASGAFEIFPKADEPPPIGWAVTLPLAGAYCAAGGGLLLDPFAGRPSADVRFAPCNRDAWDTLVQDARSELRRRTPATRPVARKPSKAPDAAARLDPRTRELIEGRTPEGARNSAVFAGTLNMLGCGVDPNEAVRLALDGAKAAGLPEAEVRSTIKSALRQWEGR